MIVGFQRSKVLVLTLSRVINPIINAYSQVGILQSSRNIVFLSFFLLSFYLTLLIMLHFLLFRMIRFESHFCFLGLLGVNRIGLCYRRWNYSLNHADFQTTKRTCDDRLTFIAIRYLPHSHYW
jgi:hypothetical protein